MTSPRSDVLVIGAGPTGLFLSLLLAKLGVSVRVVDSATAPGTTSRALAVQARTLELYRQVGLADDVIARGLVFGNVSLWRGGEQVVHVDLSRFGEGISPYPFAVIFPQDQHERLLIEKLEQAGVRVERGVTIETVEQHADHVIARGVAGGVPRTYEATFVAGCDGARSPTRKSIGVGFPGGTYEHVFYVADITGSGPRLDQGLHVMLDQVGFLALFPLAAPGAARLIGTVRVESEGADKTLTWDDVDRAPIDRIGVRVDRVNWFSVYRVHHRVAESFRRGHIFLLGDAAHIHSPVGGQGMNTGLGDAMNLAWKMAAVLGRRANDDLLDTYEPERIAFARRLVATTDRAFVAATSESTVARVARLELLPRVVPLAVRSALGRRVLFATLSQTAIQYRHSAWSEGSAGALHAGDRLPWVADDNFAPLSSLDWQVHVYGAAQEGLANECGKRHLALHVFPWTPRVEATSLTRDVSYLVRPDGYVGGVFHSVGELGRYLDQHAIHART